MHREGTSELLRSSIGRLRTATFLDTLSSLGTYTRGHPLRGPSCAADATCL